MSAPLNNPRTPPLRLAGIIVLLITALILAFVIMQFRGTLKPKIYLTMVSSRAGLVMDPGSKVTYNGVAIGRVSTIQPTIVDGPFAETKELIAGYTLIQARSREEAMEWARRFPAPFGSGMDGEIEVRPLYDLEDFDAVEGIDRFKALEAGRQGEGA